MDQPQSPWTGTALWCEETHCVNMAAMKVQQPNTPDRILCLPHYEIAVKRFITLAEARKAS